MDSDSWGWPGRHYADDSFRAQQKPTPEEREKRRIEEHWAVLLTRAYPNLRDEIGQTCKQWNNAVRDHLRTETALRLSVGDDSQSVPVKVVEGMPKPLIEVVEKFKGYEWLMLNRPLLKNAELGTAFIRKNLELAEQLLGPANVAPVDNVDKVHRTAADLLSKLDQIQATEQIAAIQQDVLGAYYFHLPEVQIYWMAIGIVALSRAIDPKALTIVVLAHELAHAYTHLGKDIDNELWDTTAFAESNIAIVEGLAQFYTGVICKKLESRIPAAFLAYKHLLKLQSGAYTIHTRWVPENQAAGEIIRVSMIECRSRRIRNIESFEDLLKTNRDRIRRAPKTPRL